jgi:amidase
MIYLTAAEIAQGIRSRAFSAREVLEAFLQQIGQYNPQVNAIVTLDEEGARKQAAEADEAISRREKCGPLHGVPVTVKDSFTTAGLRTTSSYAPLKDYVPDSDAAVVARLRSAGAVLVGKTNLPELTMDYQTDSPLFGRTNNPWDLTRTPGGSSGGSAAALAAGFTALEVGSDMGGSIRVPASFCGVFGLKATHGCIPTTGHIPGLPGVPWNMLSPLIHAGPLARSIEDLRLAYEVLSEPDVLRVRNPSFPAESLTGLRIAWSDQLEVPVDDAIRGTIGELARMLEENGARVEKAAPTAFAQLDSLVLLGEIVGSGAVVSGLARRFPEDVVQRYIEMNQDNPYMRGYFSGNAANLEEYGSALARQETLKMTVEAFLTKYDAWILPVTSTVAFPHLQTRGAGPVTLPINGAEIPYHTALAAYTGPFNLTSHPVVVIPIGFTGQGLPVGVQIVGRWWSESLLMNIADRISQSITGPFRRPPGF